MRNTVFDAKQWIMEALIQGNVRSVISGNIYKDRRPSGSMKEDIVINDISMTMDFLQQGAFNVNCYVPFLNVPINGTMQFMPNHSRMKIIAEAVGDILADVFRDDYNLYIENHRSFEEESEKANYINFRISLIAYN